MNNIKLIFIQAMMISSGILFILSIMTCLSHLNGNEVALDWYVPISIILCGFISAVPTMMFNEKSILTRRQFRIRLVIHFLCLYLIIAAMGLVFKWYESLYGLLMISISFIIIYVFVWLATYWITKKDDREINEALKSIQDEE